MKDKKVALLTWHYYSNFGSALQAYAMQETLKDLGFSVKIIDYRNIKFGKVSPVRDRLRIAAARLAPGRFSYPFLLFRNDNFELTRMTQDPESLPSLVRGFDAVVAGSDQIWAPNVFNPVYMLSFVPDGIKKVSYAASIGLNDIPDSLAPRYGELLGRFDNISVRERAGAELLYKKCGIKAEVMPDPTLLLSADKYERLERRPAIELPEKPYAFCYFLADGHNYRPAVREYAEKHGYAVLGHSAKSGDSEWMTLLNGRIGPGEFLWLIRHAAAVFTDSYHGTIFSMIYGRDYLTFERFRNDDALCQNSRIYQLAETFGTADRIVDPAAVSKSLSSFGKPFDFDTVAKEQRKRAREYLLGALNRDA